MGNSIVLTSRCGEGGADCHPVHKYIYMSINLIILIQFDIYIYIMLYRCTTRVLIISIFVTALDGRLNLYVPTAGIGSLT